MRERQRIHGHEADENREVNVIMAHATTFTHTDRWRDFWKLRGHWRVL